MTEAALAATAQRVARLASAGCFVLGLGVLLPAILLLPPVLESQLLMDGRIETLRSRVAFYAAAGVLFCLAVVLAWAARKLWRRDPFRQPLRFIFAAVCTTLSGVAVLVSCELGVRLLIPPEKYLRGDAFWKYRWNKLSREGNNETENVMRSAVDRFDSQLGWVPTPGFRSDGLNINSRGMRGPREYPTAKPPGARRVVVIGDSFTFGEDVRDEQVYTALLEHAFEGVEVLNLGVRGYGTDQQVLRFEREGLALDPDLVILGFFLENIDRNLLTFRDYAKPMLRLRNGQLVTENVPISHPDEAGPSLRPELPWCRSCALVGRLADDFLKRTRLHARWRRTTPILDHLVAAVRGRGARLLVVHIPANRGIRDVGIFLEEWSRRNAVAYLDLADVFGRLAHEDRLDLYAGHWTPFGHQTAAKAIAERISGHDLLAGTGPP